MLNQNQRVNFVVLTSQELQENAEEEIRKEGQVEFAVYKWVNSVINNISLLKTSKREF